MQVLYQLSYGPTYSNITIETLILIFSKYEFT